MEHYEFIDRVYVDHPETGKTILLEIEWFNQHGEMTVTYLSAREQYTLYHVDIDRLNNLPKWQRKKLNLDIKKALVRRSTALEDLVSSYLLDEALGEKS